MVVMMPKVCQWLPCCFLALGAGLLLPGAKEACAQDREGSPSGPTRAAVAPSVADLAEGRDVSSVWIRHRIERFQNDFSADFGVSRPLPRGEVMDHLTSEVATRWGDTRWYDWVRHGVALYARFQAMTQAERKGFDMEVDTDDLTEGKVGLRVSRLLD